jgi:hypothetical protein
MNNATVSSLYCIALYDNYIALSSIIFSRSSSVRRALTVRPVKLLFFVCFLVLQNRTI